MEVDEIVVVTGSNSIPLQFLGHYGRIVQVNEYKVTVELIAGIKTYGSFRHTANEMDLRKIGRLIRTP